MNEQGLPETGAMKDKGSSAEDVSILNEMKNRFRSCTDADGESHKEGMDDLQFLKGNQWPEKQRRSREADGRPCLTINKLPTFLQQVTNDQRQNRASIKVSPVSTNAKKEIAEIIQGMIRHIEYASAADVAYDTAVNSAASIGFGYFRLVTEYEREDSFNQEIRFKRIRNPFTVYFDPASTEPDGSDAQFVIITEKMTKAEFKARYPKAVITIAGFETGSTGDSQSTNSQWVWQDMVRIAEYYRIEFEAATLYALSDGSTTWDEKKIPEGMEVTGQRQSFKRKVMCYLVTPSEVLTRTEIKCRWIPVFPVYGSEIDIDGKIYRAGVIRNAKDPAMMYNFWMTSATEEVSLRPKTPYIGAKGQFEGVEKRWAQANNRSFPYLEYEPISLEGQLAPPPSRQPMVDVPVGVLTMASHAADNIKSTTGLFDSSLGAQGTATSGKQEIAQQRQGNVANFHYTDNLTRTQRHAGRCLIDMIPNYYDATRLVRSRGEDGLVKAVEINKWDEAAEEYINDITVGQYDIAVTTGPSYATMRAEAADAMVQFGQSWPKLMDIAGDKVVKAMNWPGAEEIAERIARTIPAEIRNDPDEAPDPMQQVQDLTQKLQQAQEQLQELQQKADDNYAKVTAEQIKQETAIEVAHITAESKRDIEELSGMVKLLVANIPPPADLSAEVSEDLAESQVGESAESRQPVQTEPAQSQGPSQTEQLLAQIAQQLANPQPIHIHTGGKRRMNIQAPSGATYSGEIDDGEE